MFVSIIAAIIGEAGFPAVILRPIISGIFMAALGLGVYQILQWQVPDLVELDIEKNGEDDLGMAGNSLGDLSTNLNGGDSTGIPDSDVSLPEGSQDSGEQYGDETSLSGVGGSRKVTSLKGDSIVVEGVALPNEPEIMAKAIKHILDQDEE